MFLCGVLGENKIFEDRQVFQGGPEQIIIQAVDLAAKLLYAYLKQNG